jgi:hypothetical protein
MRKSGNRFLLAIAVGLISLTGNSQQPVAAAASPAAAPVNLSPGMLLQVEMSGDVDAKKAHPGDIFRTRLWDDVRSGDKMVLPKKTIIVGHVVAVQPRSKENQESKLTIAIDKALLKDGSEIPVHGVVERVQISSVAMAAAATNGRSYNPGMNPGSTTNVAMPSQGQAAQSDQSPGPTNIPDTNIAVRKDASGKLTVVSSNNKDDVKLKRFATLDVRVITD